MFLFFSEDINSIRKFIGLLGDHLVQLSPIAWVHGPMAMWLAVLTTLTLGAAGVPMVKLNNGVEMPVLAFAAEVGT